MQRRGNVVEDTVTMECRPCVISRLTHGGLSEMRSRVRCTIGGFAALACVHMCFLCRRVASTQ
jgi:hypothetical protein